MEEFLLALIHNDVLTDEQIDLLPKCRKKYNVGYQFGERVQNHRTLCSYVIYMKCLKYLDLQQFELEKVMARSRLEINENKYSLSGIWSLVATFDLEERSRFVDALKQGEIIDSDDELRDFFGKLDVL